MKPSARVLSSNPPVTSRMSSPHGIPALGFSLIELMIVIVILAVLASVAIPGFQDQVARSQVMAAFSELRSLTTAYEDLMLRGIDEFTLNELGLPDSGTSTLTEHCEINLRLPDSDTGEGGLDCIVQGSPKVDGFVLELSRSAGQGVWRCQSDLPEAFRPSACISTPSP